MPDHRFYFIGIGGIGMSAIARYLLLQGKTVGGYDRTPTELTAALEAQGAVITFDASLSALPHHFLTEETTVIYTPAIPSSHPQLRHFVHQGNRLYKRAEYLGKLTKNRPTIAVAGTHGKTTTTAILTHLFTSLDQKFTAFVGGIMNKQSSNLAASGDEVFLVEADEFDRSFLQLHPTHACITSVDADHLDIYGTPDEVTSAYRAFAAQIKQSLIVAQGIALPGLTYAVEASADFSMHNVVLEGYGYRFDLKTPSGDYPQLYFSQLGLHNLSNALAAFALASQYGLDEERLGKALGYFGGVQRRMQKVLENDQHLLLDDYAHHPTEINTVLNTLRTAYPQEKICAVFQPHLYSRTRDFMADFADVLSQFDRTILMPIYPAREEPITGITSAALMDLMEGNAEVMLLSKETIRTQIDQFPERIKVVLGAGDIGIEVGHYRKKLMER